MLAIWMVYATVVGAIVLGSARLFEPATQLRRRFVWVGAGLAALLVPLGRLVVGWVWGGGGASVLLGPMQPILGAPGDLIAGSVAAAPAVLRADAWIVMAWVAVSLVLLGVVAGGALWTRRAGAAWRPERIDGVDVWTSETVGPAVVGILRPRIVVPGWVRDLPAAERGMILAHERQHQLARDTAYLTGGLVAVALFPWNPALWWGLARLRHAVEADCDARVLARGAASPDAYARLLLDVATRSTRAIPLGAGFGERATSLERRFRAMLGLNQTTRRKDTAIRGALAALLVLGACSMDVNIDTAEPDEAVEADLRTTEITLEPTFTPFTVAPSILNRDEVVSAMEQEYPPLLRDAGVGGTVRVYFFIEADGRVGNVRIDKSSGHAALDDAALKVGHVYRFAPAENKGEAVPVWVSFPVTFQVR